MTHHLTDPHILHTSSAHHSPIARALSLAYAGAAFVLTFVFFTWLVVFLSNLPSLGSEPWISPSVDKGETIHPFYAALWDIGLVALFGLQHSAMARPSFKVWIKRYVPEGLERSTYVMAAAGAGFIMLAFWKPIPIVLWHVGEPVASLISVIFAIGWVILLTAAVNMGVFELLGVRQAWAWVNGREPPKPTYKQHGLYAIVPHPMYVGVALGFWAAPYMTVGHAVFSAAMTAYLLIGKHYEERDLRRTFAATYAVRQPAASPSGIRPRF
jgi:protein-S-isoprenylcysteine O-methyltransferase Ste14